MDRAKNSDVDTLIGKTLHDSHRIVRRVGRGGMGAVYEAVHARLSKKRFALKVLRDRIADDEEAYLRFRREAEIATSLGHPNIVEVLDFYETDDGRPCIVMEYLEGESLDVTMGRRGRLTPADTVAVLRPIAEALDLAHERGIIHRDLKPANIFMVNAPASESGRVAAKLLDFGISKIKDSNTLLTRQNDIIGTPYYMSPEQGRGDVYDVDHTTDIFALAIIAYQGLSGRLPFRSSTPLGVIFQICHEQPPRLSSMGLGLPVEVDGVLCRAMAKVPARRYQRASVFVAALERVLADGAATPTDRTLLDDNEPLPMSAETEPVAGFAVTEPLDQSGDVVHDADRLADPSHSAPSSRPPVDPSRAATFPLEQTVELTDSGVDPIDADAEQPVQAEPPTPAASAANRAPRVGWLSLVLLLVLAGGALTTTWFFVGSRTAGRGPSVAVDLPPVDAGVPSASQRAADDTGVVASVTGDARPLGNVALTLVLRPTNASVSLDGIKRSDNPLLLPVSTTPQRLLVSAPGHRPEVRSLVADRDRSLTIRLVRKTARSVGGKRVTRPVAPDSGSVEVTATPAAELDTDGFESL